MVHSVHRDGLRESDVVTKQFNVEDIGAPTSDYTTDDYNSFFETSDLDTDCTLTSGSFKSTQKKSSLKKRPQRVRSNTVDNSYTRNPTENRTANN